MTPGRSGVIVDSSHQRSVRQVQTEVGEMRWLRSV